VIVEVALQNVRNMIIKTKEVEFNLLPFYYEKISFSLWATLILIQDILMD